MAGAARPWWVTLPTVRIPAMRPFRATAICDDGSSPSATSFSARANRASSLSESIPTLSGVSAKNRGFGITPD